MRAALTGLALTFVCLPLAGCFSNPKDIETAGRPYESCLDRACIERERTACVRRESSAACDTHRGPPRVVAAAEERLIRNGWKKEKGR